MLLKQNIYKLTNGAELQVDVYHNHARVSLWAWDDDSWCTESRQIYLWEHSSEFLALAIDMANEHALHLVAELEELFLHADFA